MAILSATISAAFRIYSLLILIRVLLSWVNPDPYRSLVSHPLMRLLNRVTDPLLRPLRRIVPPIGGTVDISPIVALILLEIARRLLLSLLSSL